MKLKDVILFLPGPGGSEQLHRAVADIIAAGNGKPVIATVNAGLELLREELHRPPNLYMVIEQPAVMEYYREMRQAAIHGTEVWTWPSRVGECHGFQNRIKTVPWVNDKQHAQARKNNDYAPGIFGHATTVGVTMLQLLVDVCHADIVRICGMAGYAMGALYDERVQFAPLTPVDEERCKRLNTLGAEYIDKMTNHKATSKVRFLMYGKPLFAMDSWRVEYV